MFPTPLKKFQQPQEVYRLEYPAHWDQVTQKEGASCGFGPHDRDDVGLWISVMPMSVDTERMHEDLPRLMQDSLAQTGAVNMRRDETLRVHGLIADMSKDGEGGNYWVLAGGDVILFASTQVPVAERDLWNPLFYQVMRSLEITRDDALFHRQVANEVLAQLRSKYPDQDFKYDNQENKETIRGNDRVVYLSNIVREAKGASSKQRDAIITRFVKSLGQTAAADLGSEVWDEIKRSVIPILKHRDYVGSEGPTQHLYRREWLADVIICYAIRNKNIFRFVTGWDLNRWGLAEQTFHDQAMENLIGAPWPKQMMGARTKEGGRVIVVETEDKLPSSRLLHPELHKLFSSALGSPFLAGIPCRDRLVLYGNRRELKQKIARRLRKDYNASAYSITPNPFLVTPDGVAPAT
jgi:uncharacterized protein YtpQ (UPF0354 family)